MPVDWHSLFVNLLHFGVSDASVSVLEKIIRPAVVYLFLVLLLRKIGRRMLAQLNPFDLVVLLMLSNTVQNAIIGNDTSLLGGLIGAASLLGINTLLVHYYYRGSSIDYKTMDDQDIYLMRDHHLQDDAMRKLRINVGELTARAHERGFEDLHEVDTAVLYPNGTIYLKGESRDSAHLDEILREVKSLRQEVAALR